MQIISWTGHEGTRLRLVTTYHDMFEDMNPLFGFDEGPEGLFHEFGVGVSKSGYQWHAWLGGRACRRAGIRLVRIGLRRPPSKTQERLDSSDIGDRRFSTTR